MPSQPWQILNVDFLEPLPMGEMLLVVIDQHSQFLEVKIMTTTTAATVIQKLDQIFATRGIPTTEIAKFVEVNGIHHRHITPLWPQANSEVESFMKPLLKAIQTAHAQGRNWRRELQKSFLNFRSTPHTMIDVSPAELLYNHKIREKLPHVFLDHVVTGPRNTALTHNAERKARPKAYADTRRGAKSSSLRVGDSVLVKQGRQNKFSTRFDINV